MTFFAPHPAHHLLRHFLQLYYVQRTTSRSFPLLSLIPAYIPIAGAPKIQPFDSIQEPPESTPRASRGPRLFRHNGRTLDLPSPLDEYQIEEYNPPPRPKPPPKPRIPIYNTVHGQIIWALCIIGVGLYIGFAVRYSLGLYPETVINPVRHEVAHTFFLVGLGILIGIIILVDCVVSSRKNICCTQFFLMTSFIAIGLASCILIRDSGTFQCENSGKFPMKIQLVAGFPVATAEIHVNGRLAWGMKHETSSSEGEYHTKIDVEWLQWSYRKNTWVSVDNPLHRKSTVTEITTSLRAAGDADGSLVGYCRGTPCLEGRIWTTPNLVFEWNYTNPVTGKKKFTRLFSEEGQWYFGGKHRALVSLQSNGTEVFRAQSTEMVCSAGNMEWETSLVPVGLMLIAENEYNTAGGGRRLLNKF